MTIEVGVGRSLSHDARAAGREAATQAVAPLGGAPAIVILFASTGHDQRAMLAGVREVTRAPPLIGCSGEGVITQAGSVESAYVVAAMAVRAEDLAFETFAATEFGRDSLGAGARLAAQLAPRARAGDLVVLFADGVEGNCRELIAALEQGLAASRPRIVGGTAGDLLEFSKTYQYLDDEVLTGAVTALLVRGEFDVEILVTHGCDLVGEPQTITRADGCFVEEIDGQRAWDLFKDYLAEDADGLEAMHLAHLLLAERIEAADGDDPFTVRVPVRLDEARGALYFAAGLTEGTPVQIAMRNADKVCERTIEAARGLVARRGAPHLMLQLDCAGRGRLLFDEEVTSRIIEPLQAIVGRGVPWLGLHTFGEIAPVGGRTMFHNYTGVLCALYARRPGHG